MREFIVRERDSLQLLFELVKISGGFEVAELGRGVKMRNIERDRRVSVSFMVDGVNPVGLARHAVVRGTARISEGGAPELLQALAPRFLGEGVKFPPMDDPPAGRVAHISVDRVAGAGPWAG